MPENETYMGAGNGKDPTLNVRELLETAVASLKDLFQAEIRRVDERHETLTIQMQERMIAEAKRLDAIREVDATAIRVANDKTIETAATLAGTVSTSAETLRALVAANADTVATNMRQQGEQLAARIEEGQKNQDRRDDAIIGRLSVVEKVQNETMGKSSLSTPLLMMIAGVIAGVIVFIVEQLIR